MTSVARRRRAIPSPRPRRYFLHGGNGDDVLDTGFDLLFGEVAMGGAGFDRFRFNFGDTTDICFPEGYF